MPAYRRLALALVAASAPLCACAPLARAPGVAAGFVSHEMCSGVFVSRQDPDAFYRAEVRPTIHPADAVVRWNVDRTHRQVTAQFAGLATRTAVYRGEEGCLVLHGPAPAAASATGDPPATKPLLPDIAGPGLVTASDPAVKAAIDAAFVENPHPPLRQTEAIVVVHDGKLIGERYVPGYGVDVPMQGWSMSKSITNALLGILVREGKLNMDAPAPIPAWAHDARHAITPDELLRMTSGLKAGNSQSSNVGTVFDPTAFMNFDVDDMAGYAERAPLGDPPGLHWNYTNANTMLLSRIVRDAAGGDNSHVQAFARRELFDKLGMTSVVMETDAVGTPIGSDSIWATPRDWARFGMLYLDDGVAGGERILPEGWSDYSARLTPGSEYDGYGAGFWTDRGDTGGSAFRRSVGMPADSYFARGTQGQVTIIVPSARLVIVRMGFAFDDRDDMPTIARMTREIVNAVSAK